MASTFLNLDTDTTLGGSNASDSVVSSQKAIKAYVDAHSGGGTTYTAGTGIDITNNVISITSPTQITTNLVTSVSSSSTDSQYPSAKCVYDIVGDIESALHMINSGGNTVTVSIYAYGATIEDATVTIGNETFTNLVSSTTYTFEADKNESYTLRIQRSGRAVAIMDSNGNTLVGYPNTYSDDVSYTFTATSDVTYKVYADSEKVL